MKVFFDENFSPHLARGFAAFQEGRMAEERVEVLHVVDEFGKGTTDEDLISHIARQHGAMITQDYNIHRTRHLADLCRQHKIGIFFFRPPKKSPLTYWQLIEWVLKNWQSVKHYAVNTDTPYEFEITPRKGLTKL